MIFLNYEQIDNCDEFEYYFDGECYVLKENDNIVGLAKCYEDGNSIYISQIEVKSDYQGCGYGAKFVNLLKERFYKYEEIYGIATISSYLFWEAMGCVWCNSDKFEKELEDENEFSIKLSKN